MPTIELDLPYWNGKEYQDRRYKLFESVFWQRGSERADGKPSWTRSEEKAVCVRWGHDDWESKKTVYFSVDGFKRFAEAVNKFLSEME